MAISGRSSVKIGVIVTFFALLAALTWSTLRIHRDDRGWHVDTHLPQGLRHDETDHQDQEPVVADTPPPVPEPVVSDTPLPAPEPVVADKNSPAPDAVRLPSLKDIQNATLGFQKIYVLSMPTRRDKRDVIALSALYSGLEIEFVDGPKGSEIGKSERPDNWEKMFNTDNTVEASLGCWRGHMDIYRKMVLERVQSALVVEDDADWDVMIKAQMTEVARGSQYLQGYPTEKQTPPHSPYGDHWWYIATGHCSVDQKTDIDQKQWVIDKDPTTCPEKHRDMPFFVPNTVPKSLAGANKRMIFGMDRFMCTGSYAVSLAGASRIIYDQEVLLNAQTIDMAVAAMCGRDGKGNKCIGVYPPITGIYWAAGDNAKSSDRVVLEEGAKRNEEPYANRLVYSTRIHLSSLIDGATIVKSQFPGETLMKDIDMLSFKMPEGQPHLITKKEFQNKD